MASNEDIQKRLKDLETERDDRERVARNDNILSRLITLENKATVVQGKDSTPDTDPAGVAPDLPFVAPYTPPDLPMPGLEVEQGIPTADITADSATVTLQPCSITGVEYAAADTATLHVCDDGSIQGISNRGWIATVVAVEADPEADPPVEAVEGVTGTIIPFVRFQIDGDDAVGVLLGEAPAVTPVTPFAPEFGKPQTDGGLEDGETIDITVVTQDGTAITSESVTVYGRSDREETLFSHSEWTTANILPWVRFETGVDNNYDTWTGPGTVYAIGDKVYDSPSNYNCLKNHTSDDFVDDYIDDGDWELIDTPTIDGQLIGYKPPIEGDDIWIELDGTYDHLKPDGKTTSPSHTPIFYDPNDDHNLCIPTALSDTKGHIIGWGEAGDASSVWWSPWEYDDPR